MRPARHPFTTPPINTCKVSAFPRYDVLFNVTDQPDATANLACGISSIVLSDDVRVRAVISFGWPTYSHRAGACPSNCWIATALFLAIAARAKASLCQRPERNNHGLCPSQWLHAAHTRSDFDAILAATHGEKPSVVQIRADDVSPKVIGTAVVVALRQMTAELEQGALLTIEPSRTRVHVLLLAAVPIPHAVRIEVFLVVQRRKPGTPAALPPAGVGTMA